MLEPAPAATVMIVRENGRGIEVFLLRRSSRSAFMPDVYVFPGGRVDDGDRDAASLERLHGATAPIAAAYVYAAARETFEEAGLLFAVEPVEPDALRTARLRMLSGTRTFAQTLIDLNAAIDGGALRYFSRWITPLGESRRFDAHFFVARAPHGQDALADAFETHDGTWIEPEDALARYAAGTLALMYPTIKHLERLSGFGSADALLAYAASKPIHPVRPAAADGRSFVVPAAIEGVW